MKLSEYTRPDFLVDGSVYLIFELNEGETRLRASYRLKRAPYAAKDAPLVLNLDKGVHLSNLTISGVDAAFEQTGDVLTINDTSDELKVRIVTHLHPKDNLSGEGLYQAGTMLMTQCEADGFRKITAFPDRPDVLAPFVVTLVGDKKKYPVMLAGGDLIGSSDLEGGRHYMAWNNPFPIPCYLFAIVAGDLHELTDTHTTMSGKIINLVIYGEQRHVASGMLTWAMESLKRAMAFDEREYGRECDLGTYKIVVTSRFNAGAMENKGINTFNEKYVLASPETTTDQAYELVESVIVHEYSHNWTGNRVTCRHWLELGLKEGLTVFRDEEFSREIWGLRKVIQDVRLIRDVQFPEDAGPLAHPVRPSEIKDVSNMYTNTVYQKGAQVYRMLKVILGKDGFRKGMDLYFDRHDGQAVGIDDLIQCMSDANDSVDLTQFMHWFNYAGTPEVTIESAYFPRTQTLEVSVVQICPSTPGQAQKPAFHIPFKIGFVGPDGDMNMPACEGYDPATGVLHITKPVQMFTFAGVTTQPVLSLNRGFAPVKVVYQYQEGDLAHLILHDPDAFARWDAGQTYASQVLRALIVDAQAGRELILDEQFASVFGAVLCEEGIDQNLLAAMMDLPSESDLANQSTIVDPDAIHVAREFLKHALMVRHCHQFLLHFGLNQNTLTSWRTGFRVYRGKEYYKQIPQIDPVSVARRSVAALALEYMCTADKTGTAISEVHPQFETAVGMTDKYVALKLLVHYQHLPAFTGPAQDAIRDFYEEFKDESTVVNMWLNVQARSPRVSVEEIKTLQQHPGYYGDNPDCVRALVQGFAHNPTAFHALSGDGYAFLAEFLAEYTAKNPQVAAVLVEPLCEWKRYDLKRQAMMRAMLVSLKTALTDVPEEKKEGIMEKIEKALAQ